jgi:hypothetical protein
MQLAVLMALPVVGRSSVRKEEEKTVSGFHLPVQPMYVVRYDWEASRVFGGGGSELCGLCLRLLRLIGAVCQVVLGEDD